ncbi:MAG: 50S ribosomal protein L1 [Candidatus Aenigmatarchaeota archaeon]|nr:50S ribosomal protein L1 [Candidatus Aenigmarchaeota archaeon]
MLEQIENTLNELKKSEKRNFIQSVDLIVSLKGIDLKKPESKFSEDLVLPHGRGEDAVVVVFSDNLNDLGCNILTSSDIQRIASNKKEAKRMAKDTDFFLSEASLMPLIGRLLGQILAPRGKMPKIISDEAEKMVENYKKSVRIVVKNAPVIQCIVGKESMETRKIAENVESVLKFLETKLPKGRQNIGKVLLKLTMSKPVRVVL